MTPYFAMPVIGLIVCLSLPAMAAEVRTIDAIAPENIGEFVTVTGNTAGFFPPPEPRAPYAFNIAETTGSVIRVVAWPDIYERIDNRAALETTGTHVRLTAEVAEYKNRLELHLQDWEEIDVTPATGAADKHTTAPDTKQRAHDTSAHNAAKAISNLTANETMN